VSTTTQSSTVGKQAPHYNGVKVLLVEDDRVNQQVAHGILSALGALVDIANNGIEALKKIENNRYDVILMDLQMPELDGVKTAQFIRSNHANYSHVPIIAMTGNTEQEDKEKCLQAGMNDHIAKPIDVKLLFAILNKWLGLDFSAVEQLILEKQLNLPEFPKYLPGLDIESGLARLGGNKILFKRIVCSFYQNHRIILENLTQAVKQQQWQQAQEYLHQLKGSAGNISADTIFKCSADMESRLKHGDYQIEPQLVELDDLFMQIQLSVDLLENWHTEKTDISPEDKQTLELDDNLLAWQLAQLKFFLTHNNLEAETLFDSLYFKLKHFFDESIVQLIKNDINNLNYAQAQKNIDLYISPTLAQLKKQK
jgi:two-component system, sensor histidine kinase and response regulator